MSASSSVQSSDITPMPVEPDDKQFQYESLVDVSSSGSPNCDAPISCFGESFDDDTDGRNYSKSEQEMVAQEPNNHPTELKPEEIEKMVEQLWLEFRLTA